ncbi:MAG: hypothetical protein JW783_04550 [Bacteroidales bacterium]|nr:hypothetical protein [Bacteroidales bacterium]MBN2749158.1 hypothetical protein [Bacteroidales bacterium]
MKKLLIIGTVGLAILFATSCSDDEQKELTKQEAENVLTNVNSEISQTMGQMMETEGMTAINSFMNLTTYFGTTKSSYFQFFNPISLTNRVLNVKLNTNSIVKAPALEYQGLVFEEWIGTWEWVGSTQEWKHTANETNRVVFKYPSSIGATTNDATLIISNYSSVTVSAEVIPTSVNVILSVASILEPVFTLNYNAEFTSEGLPQMLSLNVLLSTFNLTALASVESRTNDVLVSFSHQLKNQNVVAMSSNLEAVIPNVTQFNPNEDYFPSSVKGFLQIGSLKVTADLKVLDFFTSTINGTPSSITTAANSNLKVGLYTYPQNDVIAHIKWAYNNEYSPDYSDDLPVIPYVVFNDGSEDLLAKYLSSLGMLPLK